MWSLPPPPPLHSVVVARTDGWACARGPRLPLPPGGFRGRRLPGGGGRCPGGGRHFPRPPRVTRPGRVAPTRTARRARRAANDRPPPPTDCSPTETLPLRPSSHARPSGRRQRQRRHQQQQPPPVPRSRSSRSQEVACRVPVGTV